MDELRIIKYLDGEMSGEELREYELEISLNPSLAEEIQHFRKVQELAIKLLKEKDSGTKVSGSEVEQEISMAVEEFKANPESFANISPEYRKKLKEAEKIYMKNRSQGSSFHTLSRIWYSAAAVVILAIILSLIIFQPFYKPPDSEIFSEYIRQFHKGVEIMEFARADNDFLFATEVYEAGDYERAAALFEMLADSTELRIWSLLYAGSAYMYINQTERAGNLFLQVIREGEGATLSQAHWSLALCYINTGKHKEAVEQLEQLREDPEYRRDVNKILRILK